MSTYRGESGRVRWHRPWSLRVFSVLLGVGFVLFGLVLWGLEQEKGGWEGSGLGHHVVSYDELTDEVVVWNEDGAIVFRGSDMGEADEWIESQRTRNFAAPILVAVAGGLLIAFGVVSSPAEHKLVDDESQDPKMGEEEPVDARWRPWRAPVSGWRWWLAIGVTAVISLGLAFFVALILAWGVAYDMRAPWDHIVVYSPLAVAGLVTAVIGGVRRWWLIIPTAVSYMLVLMEFVQGALENEFVVLAIAWVLMVGSTALIRWFATGRPSHKPRNRSTQPQAEIRT